ncbi:lysophospholipid acyltransferase family protein [Pararhodospirillum photometricum]|uniref:1-acyl-sn-glycerol-3-phosphate acyltransferase n=1 Tax=Pararhodospirillum photometricum DSM 122 TaxID=1150469 RepID=H6SJE7_PARPM|nr:lysophospholipid acyltransferase family protein [Pararhodospirillum photometricum]CCG08112.1 1-acyl-sn-glycerol-3-phosphate acyltransferase [Pararhodospirillum photometricum DSM 122]
MRLVRSLVFNIFYVLWTVVVGLVGLPVLVYSNKTGHRLLVQRVARVWVRGFLGAARWLLNLTFEVSGLENIPEGPVIFASKHQSAFETFLFHHLFDDPAYVLKKELVDIPLLGWYFQGTGMISVDREAGASALKSMVRDARAALDRGSKLVIFPEGTRVPVDSDRPYQPGIIALYTQTGAPVVPIALNSGVFWPRNSFMKRPGVISIEFLPPIAPGGQRKAFLDDLRGRIEARTKELVATAKVA